MSATISCQRLFIEFITYFPISSQTIFFKFSSEIWYTRLVHMAQLSCVEGFSDWTIFDEARGQNKKCSVNYSTLGHFAELHLDFHTVYEGIHLGQ